MATFAGTLSAVTAAIVGTKAELDATNIAIPSGALIYESDTGNLKVADGTSLYGSHSYLVSEQLTSEQRALLENAGQPGGVVILDSSGTIPLKYLPSIVKSSLRFVDNIAARNALALNDRDGIIYVTDATGDPTVTLGSATYGWNATTSAWLKLTEFESLDLDLSTLFNKTTDTLDDIKDGTNFVRMTAVERTELATLVTDAVRVNKTYNITAPSPSFFKT